MRWNNSRMTRDEWHTRNVRNVISHAVLFELCCISLFFFFLHRTEIFPYVRKRRTLKGDLKHTKNSPLNWWHTFLSRLLWVPLLLIHDASSLIIQAWLYTADCCISLIFLPPSFQSEGSRYMEDMLLDSSVSRWGLGVFKRQRPSFKSTCISVCCIYS